MNIIGKSVKRIIAILLTALPFMGQAQKDVSVGASVQSGCHMVDNYHANTYATTVEVGSEVVVGKLHNGVTYIYEGGSLNNSSLQATVKGELVSGRWFVTSGGGAGYSWYKADGEPNPYGYGLVEFSGGYKVDEDFKVEAVADATYRLWPHSKKVQLPYTTLGVGVRATLVVFDRQVEK